MTRTPAEFAAAKANVREALAPLLAGKRAVGLADIRRDLENSWPRHLPRVDDLLANGIFVASRLNELGWQRDGTMHPGYDRTPRYRPVVT